MRKTCLQCGAELTTIHKQMTPMGVALGVSHADPWCDAWGGHNSGGSFSGMEADRWSCLEGELKTPESEEPVEIDEYGRLLASTCSPEEAERRIDSACTTLASMGLNLPKFTVSRFEVVDHTVTGEGRDYVKSYAGRFDVKLSVQDQGRTLKVFLK
jgi:hypothetical protein